jgi:hypothetical protein
MNGAIYGRTVSSVPKHRRRRLVMSLEMVRLDRASSEPLYQQLYRQIREELESVSFDSSASRVPSFTRQSSPLDATVAAINSAFNLENIETILIGVPFFYRWRKGRVESA